MKINKGQFRLSSGIENLKFDLKRGQGHLFRYLMNRYRWHYYPRWQYVSRFPDHVDLETSSACDMQCPMCYTRTPEFKADVKKTLMDLSLFKKLVDECASHGAYSIRMSLRGEPFLHPNIVEMVSYAKDKGIKEVSTLTNGLRLNPELFTEVMDAGLDWLSISFDGLGEIYERVRVPAKFPEALEKIKKYSETKKERGQIKPVIKVQTVWPAIENDPQAYYDLFTPIVDQIASNPLIDYLHKDTDIIYEENFTCPVIWQRLTVSSNGKVLMCTNDEMGKHIIGDANEQTIHDIWHGKKLTEVRDIHKRHMGVELLEPCQECYIPRRMSTEEVRIGERKLALDQYIGRAQEIGN